MKNGKYIRKKCWYRVDGPAIIMPNGNGYQEWYLNGKEATEAEVMKK